MHRWRETFAEKLRGWGVDAEATRQADRGNDRNYEPLWRIKAREGGRLRVTRSPRTGDHARFATVETMEAWLQLGRALATSTDASDRDLARSIATFVREKFYVTPSPVPPRQPENNPTPRPIDMVLSQ